MLKIKILKMLVGVFGTYVVFEHVPREMFFHKTEKFLVIGDIFHFETKEVTMVMLGYDKV